MAKFKLVFLVKCCKKRFESVSEVWLFWRASHWNACAHFKLEHLPGPNSSWLWCRGVGDWGGRSFHFHGEGKSLSTFQEGNLHIPTGRVHKQWISQGLGFRAPIMVVGCYLVRVLTFSNLYHLDLHNKPYCCIRKFIMKHLRKLDWKSNISNLIMVNKNARLLIL